MKKKAEKDLVSGPAKARQTAPKGPGKPDLAGQVGQPPADDLPEVEARLEAKIIKEYGIDDAAGLAILRQAMRAHERARTAREQIAQEGATQVDRWGQVKPHPLLAAERDGRSQFFLGLKQLNLDLEPLRDGPGRPPGR